MFFKQRESKSGSDHLADSEIIDTVLTKVSKNPYDANNTYRLARTPFIKLNAQRKFPVETVSIDKLAEIRVRKQFDLGLNSKTVRFLLFHGQGLFGKPDFTDSPTSPRGSGWSS